MLLFDSNQSTSMFFTKRLKLLERAAYYRPLVNASQITQKNNNNTNNDHILACSCIGFECDQQNEHFNEEIRKAVKNAKSILLKEIQKNPQVNTSRDDNSIGLNKYYDDSSECREFLRVQYNLNNLYKQELEWMCKTCKKQTHELLKEINCLKKKLLLYEDKLKINKSMADLVIIFLENMCALLEK